MASFLIPRCFLERLSSIRQEFRTVFLGVEDCLVPLDKLDTEVAFYWRHLCGHLRRGGGAGGGNPEKSQNETSATASGSATSVADGGVEIVDVRGKLIPESPAKYMEYLVVCCWIRDTTLLGLFC